MDQLAAVNETPVHAELVFEVNGKAVTNSLTIAEVFCKNHADVLRDIRKQMEYAGYEFSLSNFAERTYESRGRYYPKIDMTEEAFTLVVMSYNTREAVQMKIKFIQEFKRMQEYIRSKPKAMNAKESILANMKMTIELNGEVDSLKKDVEKMRSDIDKRITLDYGQQQVIRNAVNKRVHNLWNENKIDKELYATTRKVYSALWKNLKDAYQVNAYPNILQKGFGEALSFIEGWRPLFNGSKTA
ncbi:Rha family transcriptional regulator [Bacillus cereus]|uniref:Rha family transcriptional regulator n=1 Tax=Bacillus cereus TaxID=1396 RepID=UPI002110F490|nr:Rha family transcriptional regulator [Bacillus cereus]MCQ6369734.1 Rha family transcriptional regulator [Bacillus cereus]